MKKLVYILSLFLCLLTLPLLAQERLKYRSGQGLQNPNISILADFVGSYQDKKEDRKNVWGFDVREVEVGFMANVDPYAKADFFLGITHQDGDTKIDIEEAYMTLLTLPLSLTARLGRFRARFGRLNPFHADQLPFKEYPLVHQEFFGAEGFNADAGVGVNWILPFDVFYSELIVEGFTGAFGAKGGATNSPAFESSTFILNTHWKNFFELGEIPTLELGLSYARRATKKGLDKVKENIFGSDITFKMPFSRYTSLIFAGEGFLRYETNTLSSNERQWGGFTYAQLKFLRDFQIGGGFGLTEVIGENSNIQNYSGWFSYLQSGFVRYRFQYEYLNNKAGKPNENRFFLRVIFILGYHTHSYN